MTPQPNGTSVFLVTLWFSRIPAHKINDVWFLAVFTDEDLADRHTRELWTDAKIATIKTPEELVAILGMAQILGHVEKVAIDPSKDRIVYSAPILDFVASIRAEMESEDDESNSPQ